MSYPKLIREQFSLGPGDAMDMDTSSDAIILRPARSTNPLVKEHGIWVYRTGRPAAVAIEDILDEVREQRSRSLRP